MTVQLIDDGAVECVGRRGEPLFFLGDTVKCTLLAPQQIRRNRVPTKVNKIGAVAKVYKNFSETRDTIRHLNTFRVISNEMPVSLLNLSCCYFSCLKMYSDKFLMLIFMRCFLKSLWQRETGRG